MNRKRTKHERGALSRRAFSATITGAFAGTLLVDATVQEIRTTGTLTLESLRDLLAYLGHPAKDASELERMRPLVEDTLRALQVIRDFEIPIDLEPAFGFPPSDAKQ